MQLKSEELWNQYYKETIHRMEDIVLWFNDKGILINWNLSALQYLGYEGKELSRLTIHALFPPEPPFNLEKSAPYYQDLKDIPVYCKNNTCFMGNVGMLLVREKQVYGICIIKNVQQMRDLQKRIDGLSQELEHANEVKNLFLANMTHELRTPLNGMMGLLAMMDTTGLSEQAKEDMKLLKDSCQSMEKIVNQVLDYTKMMAGKLEATKEVFMIQEWMAPIVRINQSLAESKGLQFEIHLDPQIPLCLWGDKDWIGQVLNNLLHNSVKFTEQGSVRLEMINQAETKSTVTVLFVVSDTGIGINEKQMKHLFQSFSQADSSITRKYGGTGLGLAISKGIVEIMGGTLEVESTYLKGSRFYFELVLEKCDSVKTRKPLDKQYEDAGGQNETYIEGHASFLLTEGNREREHELVDLLSQISLCLELGSWERAQVYGHQIKNLLKVRNPELSKHAFRLELATRRKDFVGAKKLFEDLKDALERH